jgi:hypothetical protein
MNIEQLAYLTTEEIAESLMVVGFVQRTTSRNPSHGSTL